MIQRLEKISIYPEDWKLIGRVNWVPCALARRALFLDRANFVAAALSHFQYGHGFSDFTKLVSAAVRRSSSAFGEPRYRTDSKVELTAIELHKLNHMAFPAMGTAKAEKFSLGRMLLPYQKARAGVWDAYSRDCLKLHLALDETIARVNLLCAETHVRPIEFETSELWHAAPAEDWRPADVSGQALREVMNCVSDALHAAATASVRPRDHERMLVLARQMKQILQQPKPTTDFDQWTLYPGGVKPWVNL